MKQTELINRLKNLYPDVTFKPAKSYYWSPKDKTVFYQDKDNSEIGQWTMLHETSHGLQEHTSYQSDFELVLLEVEAWEVSERFAEKLGISINQDHVQDCLDSYRDWQYKRSLCPSCDLGGVQIDISTYKCMFCNDTWRVSAARFCRPYRRKSV